LQAQAVKGNVRSGACKTLDIGVEAELSHAANRQGAARTPSVSPRFGTDNAAHRQKEANAPTRMRKRFGLIHEQATSFDFNLIVAPFEQASGDFHKPSGFTTRKDSTPRRAQGHPETILE
jgi:hypothetical protein